MLLLAAIAYASATIHPTASPTPLASPAGDALVAAATMKLVWVTVALAGATLLLFVATFLVALWTGRLGKDTLLGNEQADIHHQRQFSPILVPEAGSSRWVLDDEDGWGLRLTVKNVGPGPAFSIFVSYLKTGLSRVITMVPGNETGSIWLPIGTLDDVELSLSYMTMFNSIGDSKWAVLIVKGTEEFEQPAVSVEMISQNLPEYMPRNPKPPKVKKPRGAR